MKKFFHKVTIITIILLAMLIFNSCENSDKQVTSNERLTTKDFLYDFDYMMQAMEDTFPYFGVVERRLGVDIRSLGRETRATIENYPYSLQGLANEMGISIEDMPDLDEHIFWSIIEHEFFSHFMGFAHNYVLNFGHYNMLQPIYSQSDYTPNNHHAFTNAVSQRFYQEQEALFRTLVAEDQEELCQFIFRIAPSEAKPPQVTSIVKTEIIREERIAYLNFPNFWNSAYGYNIITDLRLFYRNIQKYEHLIIDIRDNGGGSSDIWRMYIIKPLWKDRNNMPDMPLYAFYRGSSLVKSLAENSIKLEAQSSRNIPETDYLLTVSEIINEYNLPHINEDDLKDLDYGVKLNTSIGNIEWRHMKQSGLQNITEYPFIGKIWILINGNNYSAAALFARHAKEMGFATLVGEQTGGAYTSNAEAYFSLPNTGIILRWDIDYLTDSDGRALNEFTTTPHYFNRPGMDAMETVLQLIKEGSF